MLTFRPLFLSLTHQKMTSLPLLFISVSRFWLIGFLCIEILDLFCKFLGNGFSSRTAIICHESRVLLQRLGQTMPCLNLGVIRQSHINLSNPIINSACSFL